MDILEAVFPLDKEYCIDPAKDKELRDTADSTSAKPIPIYEPGTYNRYHSPAFAKSIKESFVRDYNHIPVHHYINK